MKYVAVEETVDMGAETHLGSDYESTAVWDYVLVSLYGDIALSEYDSDQPVDYDAAMQGDSLVTPLD